MKHYRVFLVTILLLAVVAVPALACTGKTVTIARTGDLQQEILAQMLVIRMDARTGTIVEEKV